MSSEGASLGSKFQPAHSLKSVATFAPDHTPMALLSSPIIFPPWTISSWEAVDDRVRGGKSVSELSQCDGENRVRFSGILDITALGGAGFASQRFQFSQEPLHLPKSQHSGIRVNLCPDQSISQTPKQFALLLNTEPIVRQPDGRVESRVVWEASFTTLSSPVNLTFDTFRATYRGRPVEPPPILDTSNIYDLSLMCRSEFGKQSGRFELCVSSIEAIRKSKD